MLLAVQADGATIETVEGLARRRRADAAPAGVLRPPRAPVRLLHARDADERDGAARAEPARRREDEIRKAIQGNICRCTGYVNIVEAIKAAASGSDARPRRRRRSRSSSSRARRSRASSGTNVPRKEDKRLVQGEGVFFDDVKRHGMGYVHFVRSPYAHAKIVSIDVSKALELDGVYGTLTGDEVAILTDPFFEMSVAPGRRHQGLRARGRQACATSASRSPRSSRRRASSRATRPSWSRSSTSRCAVVDDRERRADADAPILHDDAGSNVVWQGVFDWGDYDGALAEADHVVRIERLHFDRFSSTPLECARRASSSTTAAPGSGRCTATTRCPASARSGWRPRCAPGIDKLRFVTQDIGGALRQQDLPAPAATSRCCLLARKLNRPVQWTEWRTDQHMANAHGNERIVPRRRGAGEGRRHDARLQGAGDRRLRRVPALRAARLHHLGAGHARLLPLAEHPRRLHAGLHEQVAGVAEPRLLAHAAPLADRADHRHRRAASSSSTRSRCASATTCAPTRCRTRRRTAASTTPATTRAASTSRSS